MKGFHLWIAVVSALVTLPGAASSAAEEAMPPVARPAGKPIRLRFDNTDVSEVLQALGLKTRANIVFPSQMKRPISINVAASSADEALRYVTAAAGLTYRLVGRTYVVASAGELKQALEPFGAQTRLSLNTLEPENAVKLLEGALPFLTARAAGNQVLVVGAEQDIAQARALLEEQDKPQASDPAVAEVVVMQYVPASQIASMIKTIYPGVRAQAVGIADKRGGAIGLAGPHSQVESVKGAIRQMDVPTGEREPERVFRIYAIKYSGAAILQAFLAKAAPDIIALPGPESYSPPAPNFRPITGASVGSSAGGSSGSGSGSSGGNGASGGSNGDSSGGAPAGGVLGTGAGGQAKVDRAKTLVLSGRPNELDAAFKLLEQVDVAPNQVMVEVRVVDTSPERAEELGFKWSWQPFGLLERPAATALDLETGKPTSSESRPLHFGQFSRVPLSFQTILGAMITRKEAKILADPRIMVIDNDDASIFIGDTIRTQITQAGLTGTSIQVLEFPVGIILLVRPRINADGRITMRVHPVVSTITGFGPGNLPQSSSREAETTVMVKDGETIVIGGLIRDEFVKTVQEVPLLSKLPLIGELFRNRSTNRRRSDVLIFITPRIVKS